MYRQYFLYLCKNAVDVQLLYMKEVFLHINVLFSYSICHIQHSYSLVWMLLSWWQQHALSLTHLCTQGHVTSLRHNTGHIINELAVASLTHGWGTRGQVQRSAGWRWGAAAVLTPATAALSRRERRTREESFITAAVWTCGERNKKALKKKISFLCCPIYYYTFVIQLNTIYYTFKLII